ncbi:MAG: ATP-binding protein [Pyrinomonadaceae bacterium]
MGIRPKFFLIFFALGLLPTLGLSSVNYWYGTRAVESLLRSDVERDALAVARSLETLEHEHEARLTALAAARSVRDYVRRGAKPQPSKTSNEGRPFRLPVASSTGNAVPDDVRADVGALLLRNEKYYEAIMCLDADKQTLFRVEPSSRDVGETVSDLASLRYQTEYFLPGVALPDERVWTTPEQTPLRSGLTRESTGVIVRYTVPVFAGEEGGASATAPRGALVVDLNLNALLKEAAASFTPPASSSPPPPPARLVVVLDRTGRIVYHMNEALLYQSAISAAPPFKPVADAMRAGESGWKFYYSPDGNRWLAAYRPAASLELSVAAAGDYTAAARSLHRMGLASIILSTLVALVAAMLLARFASRKARSIERVTEGAVAIAGGNLNQRIEARSSDDVRLLADSLNLVTDRLREQIARDAETRQFQSFMRLSAMLTHDLKNAISSLSLLVRNMERQFHKEEFRADAMRSLKDATDKLRAIVARLSEPVRSLSGEFQMPRPTDLVPVIKRVLASTAGQTHTVETRLPSSLVATVDGERLEKVIENLVLNALEAMGTREGKLTVEGGTEGENSIYFSIGDTGPGMSEEFQRTRLFHPFATTKAKGIGLGLYTCREVIRAHGGRIDVKSGEGTGTTFRVVLPSNQITQLVSSSR